MPRCPSRLALFLIGLAIACTDSPTELNRANPPVLFATIGSGIIRGGGVDGASNSGSVPGSNFPPRAPEGESWSTVPGYGWRLNDPCQTSGLCFNGDLVSSFGSLPHPDGTPPPQPNDRFAIISTADFICLATHSGCENPGAVNVPLAVHSTAVQTPMFRVPLTGDYQLDFRWAFLSNANDLGMDNFGRIQLLDLTENTTVDLVSLTSGDIGDFGKPPARLLGCGHHVIATPSASYDEQYDLCTDWQSFSTPLGGRAGHSLRLRFEVTEVGVGDNVATTLAFEDVELAAAPIVAEGVVKQVEGPAFDPPASYAWSVQPGCTIVTGTAASQTVSFTCADNGVYQLNLVTTDEFGGPLGDDASSVTVTNVAPTVNPISVPAQIVPNSQFTASATFTDPGSGDTHAGVWDWGDGTKTDPATLISSGTFANTHTYAQPGNYTITLTVTDDDAGSDAAQVTRLVQPTVLAASIDIWPGVKVNLINLRLHPLIPVALFGSASFDVTKVAVSTLRFGPGAAPALLGALRLDLNRDGYKDLLSAYSTNRTGIEVGQTRACLTGSTNGMLFEGCDAITVVSGR
jgi:PKD repeat protein